MTFLFHFGRYVSLLGTVFTRPEKVSMYWKETARQMNSIGVGSFVIVAIVAVFIGAVTAVQFAYQLGSSTIPIWYVGYIVRDSLLIELAPTISCMVLAGKVGSNIATELGGMRQKEQIDALEIMGVDTGAYLVGPRLMAGIVVIPMLVTVAVFMGIFGGYLAGIFGHFITPQLYKQGLLFFFQDYNVVMMLIKAVVFAFILCSVSAYQGYYVKGGSIELGEASTRAVVFSNILILLFDYIIATILT